jgi:hypothetical protein
MSTITGKTVEQVRIWVSTQPHFAARYDSLSGCLYLRNDNETLRINRKVVPQLQLEVSNFATTNRLFDWAGE